MGTVRDARREGFDLYKTDLDLPVHTASLDVESKRALREFLQWIYHQS
jgi:hypothetical protein